MTIAALMRKGLIALLLVPVLAALFAGLLTASFSLPNAPITQHLLEREDLLDDRRTNNGRVIDADTECIGLSVGLYQSGTPNKPEAGPFKRAMHAKSLYGCEQFQHWLKTGKTNTDRDYFRYWHGYAIVTRPALSVVPYNDLRGHLFNLSVLLLGIFVWRIAKDFGVGVAIAIAAPFVVLNAFGFWVVATKAVTWFLLMGGALMVSRRSTATVPVILFFILGALTAFFDFFTAPALVFALAAFVHFLYCVRDDTMDRPFRRLLMLGLFWGAGYAGLWAAKFVIAAMVLELPVWRDVVDAAFFRLRGASEHVDTFLPGAAIFENLTALKSFWGLVALFVFGILPFIRREYRSQWHDLIHRGRIFMVIAMIPILWLEVLSNHSQIHAAFTQLNLALVFMMNGLVVAGWAGGKAGILTSNGG